MKSLLHGRIRMSPRYALKWLHHLSATCSSALSSQPRKRGAAKRRPLHLEMLEDRSVPAIVNWTGAVDGNWNNAANWYNTSVLVAVVPTDGDELVFDSANLTGNKVTAGLVNNLDSLLNVHSIDIANGSFSITGNSLNVQSDVTVSGNGGDDTLGIGIFGSASIIKSGASNLTLAGNSGFTGDVTVTGDPWGIGGKLIVASNNALGSTEGVTTIASGASLVFQDVDYSAAELLEIGDISIGGSGESSFAGNIQMHASGVSFEIAVDSQLELKGEISEATSGLGFQLIGHGMLILASTNTFTGNVSIVYGSLRVTADGALGTTDGVTKVEHWATLDFSDVDYMVQEHVILFGGNLTSTFGSSEFDGTIEFRDYGIAVLVNDGAYLRLNGNISHAADVYISGEGTLAMGSTNSFSGVVYILNGVVEILVDGALGLDRFGTTVGPGGVLSFVGVDYNTRESIRTVGGGIIREEGKSSFGGLITLEEDSAIDARGVFTLNGNGAIYGNSKLSLIGSGLIVFTADNSYDGDTAVNEGALGGTGSLTSDIFVESNATILPGGEGAPGIFTTTGSTRFTYGSYFAVEIMGPTAGQHHDQFVTNGITIDGAFLEVNTYFEGPDRTEIVIISNTGGAVVGTFAGLDEGECIVLGDVIYQVSYVGGDGNDVSLTIVTQVYERNTIGAYNSTTATWTLGEANGIASYTFQYGFSSGIAVTGDWDGDGQDTIGIYNPRTATWYLRNDNSAGSPDYIFSYGFSPGIPVVGDWDGDGKDTIGIYDPRTAIWRLRNSNSAGSPDITFAYGFGANPVVGNWDGVGGDGIGVYNTNTATWYLRNTPSAGSPDAGIFAYGFSNVKPVTGDWNDDGVDGIGIWSKSTAISYLRETADAGSPNAGIIQHGTVGSQAVTGSWNPSLSSLLTAGGGQATGRSVAELELTSMLAEALRRWNAPSNYRNRIDLIIGDLPGNGISKLIGSVITIDRDAAGYGWHIDWTSWGDSKFADGKQPAGVDLLTAVMHELGHAFGFDDTDDEGVMARTLRSGVRHSPTPSEIDAVLNSGIFDDLLA